MNFIQFLLTLKARKQIILLVLLLTVATTTVVSLIIPPTYEATATVLVDSRNADPVTGMIFPPEMLAEYMATQADIIASHNVALRVVNQLGFTHDPLVITQFNDDTHGKGNINDWLADLLLKKLKVDPSREGSTIDITFSSPNAEASAAVTNAFVNAYIATNLDLKTQPEKQAAAWYDERLKDLRDKLRESQQKLTSFQNEHGMVIGNSSVSRVTGASVDTETAKLDALLSQLVTAQAQSYDSASRQKNAGNNLVDVLNNPIIQNIRSDLLLSEAKLDQISATEGANNPEYKAAQTEVNNFKQKLVDQTSIIQQSVGTTAKVSQQSVNELRSAVEAQKTHIFASKDQLDQGNLLLQEVADKQRAYDLAMQTANQVELQSKASQNDISILNVAVVPAKPAKPNLILNIILSIMAGSVLSTGFAMVSELLDKRVRSANDLSDELNLPVLGVITTVRKKRSLWARSAQA